VAGRRTNDEHVGDIVAEKQNILVIWGDDIGITNLSCYSDGLMGYRTPNIDRIAAEGARFTDYYGEQSCTAGRAAFITGQNPYRTGLTKVGFPGADIGIRPEDPTIATALNAQGYATGQFGKNHLGDRDEFLPTMHGFDECFGNLYHLYAEEEPEHPDYPSEDEFPNFRTAFGPRGVIRSFANGDGTQTIEDTSEYHDVMCYHDDIVGDLLATLDELGIAENTIVIYSTDNGPRRCRTEHSSDRNDPVDRCPGWGSNPHGVSSRGLKTAPKPFVRWSPVHRLACDLDVLSVPSVECAPVVRRVVQFCAHRVHTAHALTRPTTC
jgi:arylsulfatase A-like enzyme